MKDADLKWTKEPVSPETDVIEERLEKASAAAYRAVNDFQTSLYRPDLDDETREHLQASVSLAEKLQEQCVMALKSRRLNRP